MRWMKDNKKVRMGILIVCAILVCAFLTFSYVQNQKIKKEKLGISLYEKIHLLYSNGGELNYDMIEEDGLYKVFNYEVVSDLVSRNLLQKTNEILGIQKKENTYYISPMGRGNSNYLETKLTVKKMKPKKVSFTATTFLCETGHMRSYGCEAGYIYTTLKPFVIVKENNTWKVSEYTSVFELKDSEIK